MCFAESTYMKMLCAENSFSSKVSYAKYLLKDMVSYFN